MIKYPFLPQARQHIAKNELEFQAIAELPLIRERAKQRVSAAFMISHYLSEKPNIDYEIEIASFPVAILYVAGAGDRSLIERFALVEAQQVNRYLMEEKNQDVILEIAKTFKWNVQIDNSHRLYLHFEKFIENAIRGRLTHSLKWKLVNRELKNGWVGLTPFELARLLQEEVKKRIEEAATREVKSIPPELQNDIDELKDSFLKMKPHLEEFDQIVHAQESEYPPCITGFMKRASQGQHLSHVERFTLVTYLLHQKISIDSIVNLFSNVSDFKEDKTRYQIEHLAGLKSGMGQPYVTYNCSTLQTHGVCPKPNDSICRYIRNPLTYHLKKQRKTQLSAYQPMPKK